MSGWGPIVFRCCTAALAVVGIVALPPTSGFAQTRSLMAPEAVAPAPLVPGTGLPGATLVAPGPLAPGPLTSTGIATSPAPALPPTAPPLAQVAPGVPAG